MNWKCFRTLLLLLLISALLAVPAYAEGEAQETLPYYVSDVAGVLNSEDWQQLEADAARISETYQCGVYIVTLDDYKSFSATNSFWNFSQEFYNRYNMGIGESRNGILLIMSMSERDYSLLAYGSDAHYAFTDYGKEVLEQQFLDNFRNNDWSGGFADYLSGCESMLARAAQGNPLDVAPPNYVYSETSRGMGMGVSLAIVVLAPCLIAFAACSAMKRQMKPVSRSVRADDYLVPGGVNLSLKRDVFLNRVVTTRIIQTPSDNHRDGGGGGTTINAGGFSGHSGKF